MPFTLTTFSSTLSDVKGEADREMAIELKRRGHDAVAVLTNNTDFAIFPGERYEYSWQSTDFQDFLMPLI